MDTTNENENGIPEPDSEISNNDITKTISEEEHMLLEQDYSTPEGQKKAFMALELLIQHARDARDASNTDAELSNFRRADEILLKLEAEFEGLYKGKDQDQYATYVMTKTALLRKRFIHSSSMHCPQYSFDGDTQIFYGIDTLWSLAFKIQDKELRSQVSAWANEMMCWRERNVEVYGKGDEHAQTSWDVFRHLTLKMKHEIEQNPNIGQLAKFDAEESDDEIPNWLGEAGYEKQTMEWLSWKEQLSEITVEDDSLEIKEETTSVCESTIPLSDSSISGFPFLDACSCGKECDLAKLPPIPEEDEDILTQDELQYRQWAIQDEHQIQEDVKNILDYSPKYKSTLEVGDRIELDIYEYAFEIAALAKGKFPIDDEMYGDENTAYDLTTPADYLYLALKIYYLSLFRNMKRERDFEVNKEVLKIVRGLVLWDHDDGIESSEHIHVGNDVDEDEKLPMAGFGAKTHVGTAADTSMETEMKDERNDQGYHLTGIHGDKADSSSGETEVPI